MEEPHFIESMASTQAPASPAPWPSAHSVPLGEAERGRTDLLTAANDSPPRLPDSPPRERGGVAGRWQGDAGGRCGPSRVQPCQQSCAEVRGHSQQNNRASRQTPGTGSQKALSGELQKDGANRVLGDLGSTSSWYRRGNQSERACAVHSWQSQRTRYKEGLCPRARANLNCNGLPSVT
ncbi:unnamed protein product [Rangifer tarandus platyrhynchus]|uniref:Uncharacterized protein n=2 Tax=Rangifer tarandus platyrhynchus TaxID=3082113 RepID=A0ACB1KI76_RANTA